MLRRALAIVMLLTLTGCSWFLPNSLDVPSLPPTDKILTVRLLSEPLDEPTPDPIGGGEPVHGHMQIREWTRDVFSETNTERISLTLENEQPSVYFVVVFAGYRMNEPMEAAFTSDMMYAPAGWGGTLTFDVPLGEYYRLYGASIMTSVENDPDTLWPRSAVGFAPPCPDFYPWPAGYTYEDCLAEVGE